MIDRNSHAQKIFRHSENFWNAEGAMLHNVSEKNKLARKFYQRNASSSLKISAFL